MAKARFGNVFDGLVEGLQIGDQMKEAEKRRQAADLAAEETRMRLDAARQERADREATQQALKSALNPGNPEFNQETFMRSEKATANGDAQPLAATQAPKVRMFDAYEKAGTALMGSGLYEQGEKFLKAADGFRARHIATEADKAVRMGGPRGLQYLLSVYDNDVPDGRKSEVSQDPQTGKVTILARDASGQPVGNAMTFDDPQRALEYVYQSATAPTLMTYLSNLRKDSREDKKVNAEVKKSDAEAELAGSRARGQDTENDLNNRFGEPLTEAKIRASNAQAALANASARLHVAQADALSNGQTGARGAGGAAGEKPDQVVSDQAVIELRKRLVEAYLDPLKRGSLSKDQARIAEGLIAQASMSPVMSKRTGQSVARQGPDAPAVQPSLSAPRVPWETFIIK